MTRACRGFALILVIWALVLLSSLAGGFAFAVRHEARAAADMELIARAEAAATAALHTAVLALANPDPELRWQPDSVSHPVPWPGASISVSVRPESSRIDLNLAPRALLSGLFTQLYPDQDSAALAAVIIDWRDRDDRPQPAGAEQNAYLEAGYNYTAKNDAFDSVSELSQVIGFDGRMVDQAYDYLTVNSRQAKINVVGADLITLTAVPGVDRGHAEAFINQRSLSGGNTLDLTLFGSGRRHLDTKHSGESMSIDIEVKLADGLAWRERAAIRLDRNRGYQLLSRETRPASVPPDNTQ